MCSLDTSFLLVTLALGCTQSHSFPRCIFKAGRQREQGYVLAGFKWFRDLDLQSGVPHSLEVARDSDVLSNHVLYFYLKNKQTKPPCNLDTPVTRLALLLQPSSFILSISMKLFRYKDSLYVTILTCILIALWPYKMKGMMYCFKYAQVCCRVREARYTLSPTHFFYLCGCSCSL